MSETMRDFPTAVALSAITGFMVHEPFSDVHECLTYMAGQEIWTHQLPRVCGEAKAWAIANRPEFIPAINEAKTITKDNWRDVLAVWLGRYGPTIALPVLNSDQHESIDPLSELVEKVHPSKIVVADVGGAE
ncbi:MAG: hypothetical protein ACOVVK_11690 [Elsteraceae bacterium]